MAPSKIFFILIATFLFCIPETIAQSRKKSGDNGPALGLRIGTNFAEASIKNYNQVQALISQPRTNTALIVGGFLNFEFSDRVSIQTELTFIKKGFAVDEASYDLVFGQPLDNTFGFATRASFNYIEFSPNLKYTFNTKVFSPYATLGPYVGYALSGNIKDNINIGFFSLDLAREELNLQNEIYNRIDLGISGGFGIQAKYGIGFTFMDLQFGYSINSFMNNTQVQFESNHLGVRWCFGTAFYL